LEDQLFSYDGDSKKAEWCYCKDITDKSGSKFSDNMPPDLVALWEKSLNCENGYDDFPVWLG